MPYPGTTDNISFGQLGCEFQGGTTAFTVPTGKVIVAITFTENSTLTTLTPTTDDWCGTGSSGVNGDDMSGDTIPKGMTIYGRWSALTLASGAAIAYFGV
jgi:hypothetical protein